jgi:hypothetical protein
MNRNLQEILQHETNVAYICVVWLSADNTHETGRVLIIVMIA